MTDSFSFIDKLHHVLPGHITSDDNIRDGLDFAIKEGLIQANDLSCISHFFDARHLSCPMPLLKAKVTLRSVSTGDALYLLATDKNSQVDLVVYCQKNNLTVKTWAHEQSDTIYHFLITKNP